MRILTFLFCLMLSGLVHALELPRANSVPGGIALVNLGPSESMPRARFRERPVLVTQSGPIWYAVVGLPLGLQAGAYQVEVMVDGGKRQFPFEVAAHEYESQYITIKDKRKVNPNAQDLERIGKESKRIKQALAQFSDDIAPQLALALPVEGRFSSPFGLRRFFNQQPRKPHSGLDIAAPTGTPIRAPAAGRVIETGDFFFNGNTVFLDHGRGLVTMYCHMDRIDVEVGQQLEQGAMLGTVGMTGRVTGPHLHWGVSLNDARVDPNMLLTEGTLSERQP